MVAEEPSARRQAQPEPEAVLLYLRFIAIRAAQRAER